MVSPPKSRAIREFCMSSSPFEVVSSALEAPWAGLLEIVFNFSTDPTRDSNEATEVEFEQTLWRNYDEF